MFCHSPDGATVIVVLALVVRRMRRHGRMVIMVILVMTILAIKFAEPSASLRVPGLYVFRLTVIYGSLADCSCMTRETYCS